MERQDVSRAARTIRELMRDKKYRDVVKLARSLRLDRINNGLLVLDIVEAYEKLGEKKEAKNTLLNYYDVHGITGRNMMQKLIELCIETRDISNAVGLCMEFENEWPESSISYLMRYQITTSAGGNLEERIHYLEKYKETEFEERWGYELAKLYDKNNQPEKCAEVCHEIICLFGHGKYVEKAVQLKERVAGLTEDETDILEKVKRREEEARIRRQEEERLAREEAERLKQEEEIRMQEEWLQREEAARLEREEEERLEKETEERLRREAEARSNWEKEHLKQETKGFKSEKAEYRANGGSEETGGWTQEVQYVDRDETADSQIQKESAEDIAMRKAREAEIEKIRQTEEAARLLKTKKEEERMAREQKIAQVLKSSDRYAQVEKNKAEGIYFQEFSRDSVNPETKQKRSQSGGGIFSSFGRMASDIRKTLQPDEEYMEYGEGEGEIEYITVGRDSQAYVQDIEERMLSELDMLDDEQIAELTQEQIKEIYELKVLRDVRESIKHLIIDVDGIYNTRTSGEELERFVEKDPYPNPVTANRKETEREAQEEDTVQSGEESTTETEETDTAAASGKRKTEIEETETVVEAEKREGETEETEAAIEAEEREGKTEETEATAEVEERERKTEETEAVIEVEEREGETKETEATAEVEERESKTEETEAAAEVEVIEYEIKETDANVDTEEAEDTGAVENREEMKQLADEEAGEEVKDKAESEETGESEKIMGKPEKEASHEDQEETAEIENAEETETIEAAEKKETILDRIENPDKDLTVKEFSECITAYAGTKGYQVEDAAYMTIAVLAEEMQQQSTPLSLNNAKKMTDDAIVRIQKRNPLDKIMDRYSKKRAYLLKDRHFYWKPEKS